MPTRWSVAALALASLPCVVGMGDMKVGVKNFHAGMMEQPDFDSITLFHVPTFTGEMTPYSRLERAALKAAEAAAFKHDSNRAYRHEMKALFSQEKKHAGSWLVEEPEIFPNLELEPIGYSRQWIGEEKLGGCWSSDTDPLSDQKCAPFPPPLPLQPSRRRAFSPAPRALASRALPQSDLGLAIFWRPPLVRDLDRFVPQTQNASLRIVLQPE